MGLVLGCRCRDRGGRECWFINDISDFCNRVLHGSILIRFRDRNRHRIFLTGFFFWYANEGSVEPILKCVEWVLDFLGSGY